MIDTTLNTTLVFDILSEKLSDRTTLGDLPPAAHGVCETWGAKITVKAVLYYTCFLFYITIQCTCPLSFFEQWQQYIEAEAYMFRAHTLVTIMLNDSHS